MQTKRVSLENEVSQVHDMMRRSVEAIKSGDNTPTKSTSPPAQAIAHAVVVSDDDDILPSRNGPSYCSYCPSPTPASRRACGTTTPHKRRMSDGLSSISDEESEEDIETSDGNEAGK